MKQLMQGKQILATHFIEIETESRKWTEMILL